MTATPPFQESVVELTRQIDNLLFKLGGSGRNLDERASSLRHVLNAREARRLRLVAKVNYKMIYGGGLRINRDHQRFIRTCGWMIYRLETLLATHGQRHRRALRRTKSRVYTFTARGAGVLGLLVCLALCTHFLGHVGWPHKLVMNLIGIASIIVLVVTAFITTKFVAKGR